MSERKDDPLSPEGWARLSFAERREALTDLLGEALGGREEVKDVIVEVGPIPRRYDLTAMVETDVGRLRTPLWSHARAMIFEDPSVHSANREQLSPRIAVRDAVDRLVRRLSVPYRLESRGLTITLSPEPGVERTWTAEHSRFRKRTAVTREDVVDRPGDLDVRDLLAHFYVGPSLRMVSEEGNPFLLPAATSAEGPVVTLCHACRLWHDGPVEVCRECGSEAVEPIVACRPDVGRDRQG